MSVKNTWQRLAFRWWSDEQGSTDVVAYVFVVTLMGLAAIVGLTTFRDQAVQGLGDIAQALDNLNQSYSVTTGTVTSVYVDTVPGGHAAGSAPEGISLTIAASTSG